MDKWLQRVELRSGNIKLEPLTPAHITGLAAAVQDGALWKLWYTSTPEPSQVKQYVATALKDFEDGKALPFAVVNLDTDQVIGTTRLMNADAENRRLEIGTTWYAKSFQRSGVNTRCKYLLLEHAFEVLDCIAVEFRTHWHNLQSRTAIANLGAKQDGVLRNHSIDSSGNLRDTVVFSIIRSEWDTVKQALSFKIHHKYQD